MWAFVLWDFTIRLKKIMWDFVKIKGSFFFISMVANILDSEWILEYHTQRRWHFPYWALKQNVCSIYVQCAHCSSVICSLYTTILHIVQYVTFTFPFVNKVFYSFPQSFSHNHPTFFCLFALFLLYSIGTSFCCKVFV